MSSYIAGKYIIKYASYIESAHADALNITAAFRRSIVSDSPYTSYVKQDVNTAMLGAGRIITDFSALYSTFGKFMSGMDIGTLWETTVNKQIQMSEINNISEVASTTINNTINSITMPEFKLSMRKINAVLSSSFIIGKVNIENKKVRALASIDLDVKSKLLLNISAAYNTMLNHRKNAIDVYAEIMKSYYMSTMNANRVNDFFKFSDILWPFSVLDFERAMLSTMRGTAGYEKIVGNRERSLLSKGLLVASYTVQGALLGFQLGGPVGALIGGIVGFVVGLAMVLFE